MQSITDLESEKASGTSLISLYIKAGPNNIGEKLSKEISSASNIKSKDTRLAVTVALKAIQQNLKGLHQIPENGLAIFSGNGLYV